MSQYKPYQRPAYATHADVPPGTGIFKETVLQIWPGSVPTLWRKVKAGQFPAPIHYIGPRPVWNVDHVRAVMAGTWKPSGQAT